MSVAKSLRSLRERKEISQKAVASEMYVNPSYISKIEQEERDPTFSFVSQSASALNDAQYGFELAHETIKNYITPLMTKNQGIEWHRLALEETFKVEAQEAIDHFNNVSLAKHPGNATEEELAEIRKGVKELLDVQASVNSFLAKLEQAYPFTVKECMKKRLPEWKSKGWI